MPPRALALTLTLTLTHSKAKQPLLSMRSTEDGRRPAQHRLRALSRTTHQSIHLPSPTPVTVSSNTHRQCDEATPHCTQCRRYGRPCPGYRRTFRFQDERPALERRHQSSSAQPSPTPPPQRTLPDAAALTLIQAHIARDDSPRSITPLPQQQQQQQQQQPHLFAEEMRTSFPALSSQLRIRRPGTDCAAHIAASFGQSAVQDGAVTCVTAMVRGARTHDRGLMKTARQAYAATLQQVACALQGTHHTHTSAEATQSESARGADMLAGVMLLSVYELYAQTRRDAWMVHAEGVRRLMGARGASAHGSGWGRACYLAFRGLLVAAAVQAGTACFLAGDEWVELARRVRAEDVRRAGQWGGFVGAADRAFMEVVLCPGFLAEARAVQEGAALRGLVVRVRASRGRLVRVAAELRACVQAGVGVALVLQGVESAVGLLDGLLERLRENEVLPFRVVSALERWLATPSGARDATALDRVASSMGMLGTVLVVPERC
ncbi:fungal transcriptional regulatory protein, N-terminal [Aspergillus terreus]|uniref:Fungal transcriptional regulatory protein, N-terminal n=1 Tax=Aspergillus terreus TaxID=33178 RepID=A0A5M3Z526_ASPTE|nr:hypothetical protein ATETN484_0009044400 [Aspergillus terreus]GFF17895.1 fungal transcriptional regulatory protein, N-terminal [Aspergillus terreus]